MSDNPLLAPWNGQFSAPPFAAIRDDHFEEAINAALKDCQDAIREIANQSAEPDFDNTVVAMERITARLGDIVGVFFNIQAADTNDTRQAIMLRMAPKLAEHEAQIFTDPVLYRRFAAIPDGAADLDGEQMRLLDDYRAGFVRAGAALEPAERQRCLEIKSRLATLMAQFDQNILSDENDWSMALSTAQLDALPAFLASALRDDGKSTGTLPLSQPLVIAFLTHSPDRAARRAAYLAWRDRGANGNDADNRPLIAEILALRAELAALLGYQSYAAFKLEREMAKSPDAVRALLEGVWRAACQSAEEDRSHLERMMRADGIEGEFAAWDWRYFANRRRSAEFGLEESEIKRHFTLDNMIDAAFNCAKRLFGLDFIPIDLHLYHPDCRAWEVSRNGRHVALFIGDYFCRPSKRSGAWCSGFRSQHKLDGDVRPIVVNVCNFTAPKTDEPCALSYDDARVLFHEFGHALHAMLSDVTHESVSGTSVARDFVELPSQLFEHWLEVPDLLTQFALNIDDRSPIPDDLVRRILDARGFDQGFAATEYLASAFLDLAFHETSQPFDPSVLQDTVLAELGLPQGIGPRHAPSHFAHVFASDGYAAGYYSYMWSEVMDADAFEAFEEADGAFDTTVAAKLEKEILSVGDSVAPDEAYRRFRGRDPDPAALLRKRGFAPAN